MRNLKYSRRDLSVPDFRVSYKICAKTGFRLRAGTRTDRDRLYLRGCHRCKGLRAQSARVCPQGEDGCLRDRQGASRRSAVRGPSDHTLIGFLSFNGAEANLLIRGGHDSAADSWSGPSYRVRIPARRPRPVSETRLAVACHTPFRQHKCRVREGGIAIPCILHWPAGGWLDQASSKTGAFRKRRTPQPVHSAASAWRDPGSGPRLPRRRISCRQRLARPWAQRTAENHAAIVQLGRDVTRMHDCWRPS